MMFTLINTSAFISYEHWMHVILAGCMTLANVH